jgi:hypothetical protein
MLVLGGFVVVLSGYFGFAAHRGGASLHRALLMGALSAALLLSIVSSGMVLLSGLAGGTRHRDGHERLGSGLRDRCSRCLGGRSLRAD